MKNEHYPISILPGSLLKLRSFKLLLILISILFVSISGKGQNLTEEYYQTKLKPNTTIGYWSYLPPAYKNSNEEFPLMIFLHGLGQIGSNLNNLFYYGPPKLIRQGKWPADRPFIVISPQTPSVFGGSWNTDLIDEIIDRIVAEYRVDESRIYITGTSMGGNGTWKYATAHPERVAAIVPISGWGQPNLACNMKNVPTWAFHNEGDGVVNVSGTKNMINALNKCSPQIKPKQVIYPQSGHDAWSRTYDLSAGHDIYTWLLSHTNPNVKAPEKPVQTNKAPIANAGPDKTLVLPQNATDLVGSGSDSDGKITSYKWTKVNGPSMTMQNENTARLALTNLVAGTYTFRLTVTDDKKAIGTNDVTVTVLPHVSKGTTVSYAYYEGSWSSLPVFDKLTPKKTGTIDNFSLSPRNRNDNFAFQFQSYIEVPTNGDYSFYTTSDDGSKLYIDNKEVVSNDGLHGKVEKSGKVYLTKGKHQITVSYFERAGDEILEVRYSGPNIQKQLIPNNVLKETGETSDPVEVPELPELPGKPNPSNGLSYTYYEGIWRDLPDFSSLKPLKTGIVSNFDLSPAISKDYFAFKFEGTIRIAQSGTYTFYTTSDDGNKLYINNQEVVENGGMHSKKEKSGKIYLEAGLHPIKVTYYERTGSETLEVRYSGPGISKRLIPNNVLSEDANIEEQTPPNTSLQNGLNYRYYEGSWDKIPNFDQLKSAKTGVIQNFSLTPAKRDYYYGFEFEGKIKIDAGGNYTFFIRSDDGSKVYINGKELINNDGLHASEERSGKLNLSTGMHSIKVTYFQKAGGKTLKVYYQGPGISKQVIPEEVLFASPTMSTSALESKNFAKSEARKINTLIEDTKAYPNPFTDQLNIKVVGEYEGIVTILLLDLQGKEIFNKQIDAKELGNNLSVPTSHLSKGIYFLQIINGTKKEVVKLVKN